MCLCSVCTLYIQLITIQVNNSSTIDCKCTIKLPLTKTIQYYNNYYKLYYYDSGYVNVTIICTAIMYILHGSLFIHNITTLE